MAVALPVGAVLALALHPTRDARVIALAVLLLALALLAVASPPLVLLGCRHRLDLGCLLGQGDGFEVVVVILAATAGALGSAHLPRGEALTIHLEAFGLLAGAPCFLTLLDVISGGDELVVAEL